MDRADVKKRISKARVAFHLLENVWQSKVIRETTKICLFNTNVKSVLLYGAVTWRIKTTMIRIQTFVNHYLRRILRIHWMDRVSNKDLWDRTHQAQIYIEILKRRWGWLGHTLRKPSTNITRQVPMWNPHGKRKRGRPKNTWRRDLEADIKQTGNGCSRQEALEKCCGWPMLQEGLKERTVITDHYLQIFTNLPNWTSFKTVPYKTTYIVIIFYIVSAT